MTRRGWVLFVAMGVIWGLPYLFIRVAVRELSPASLVLARTAPAALLLAPFVLGRRQRGVPLRGHWRWIVLFAVVEVAAPWYFLSAAEQHLASSTAGLLIAAVPLVAALLYRYAGHTERLTGRRLVGLVVGFAGVAALVGIDVGGSDHRALAAMVVPIVGYALGPLIVSRRLADLPSLAVVAAALGLTALLYAPTGIAEWPSHLRAEVIASVVVLAVVCTALGFVVFFALIAEVGPARATIVTYLNPAVAVLLGVVVLGEPLTAGMLVGFPLIIIGSAVATGSQVSAPRE